MSQIIRFDRDDQLLEIVEKVNKALKTIGAELVDVTEGDDEEVCLHELKVDEDNKLKQLRELVRKAPLGYYQGRLIKNRSTTEQDVVNWLANLHQVLEL